MSIFDDKYPMSPTYCYLDAYEGGRLNNGAGMTYEEGNAVNDSGRPLYPYNGNWSIIDYPARTILIGNGQEFQPIGYEAGKSYIHKIDYNIYGYEGKSLECILQTRPFIFSTLRGVKELVSLNIAIEGTGLLPTLTVYTQKNYHSPKAEHIITPYVNGEGYVQYFLRDIGEYKVLTFKLSWTNTASSYISAILAISLTVVPKTEVQR